MLMSLLPDVGCIVGSNGNMSVNNEMYDKSDSVNDASCSSDFVNDTLSEADFLFANKLSISCINEPLDNTLSHCDNRRVMASSPASTSINERCNFEPNFSLFSNSLSEERTSSVSLFGSDDDDNDAVNCSMVSHSSSIEEDLTRSVKTKCSLSEFDETDDDIDDCCFASQLVPSNDRDFLVTNGYEDKLPTLPPKMRLGAKNQPQQHNNSFYPNYLQCGKQPLHYVNFLSYDSGHDGSEKLPHPRTSAPSSVSDVDDLDIIDLPPLPLPPLPLRSKQTGHNLHVHSKLNARPGRGSDKVNNNLITCHHDYYMEPAFCDCDDLLCTHVKKSSSAYNGYGGVNFNDLGRNRQLYSTKFYNYSLRPSRNVASSNQQDYSRTDPLTDPRIYQYPLLRGKSGYLPMNYAKKKALSGVLKDSYMNMSNIQSNDNLWQSPITPRDSSINGFNKNIRSGYMTMDAIISDDSDQTISRSRSNIPALLSPGTKSRGQSYVKDYLDMSNMKTDCAKMPEVKAVQDDHLCLVIYNNKSDYVMTSSNIKDDSIGDISRSRSNSSEAQSQTETEQNSWKPFDDLVVHQSLAFVSRPELHATNGSVETTAEHDLLSRRNTYSATSSMSTESPLSSPSSSRGACNGNSPKRKSSSEGFFSRLWRRASLSFSKPKVTATDGIVTSEKMPKTQRKFSLPINKTRNSKSTNDLTKRVSIGDLRATYDAMQYNGKLLSPHARSEAHLYDVNLDLAARKTMSLPYSNSCSHLPFYVPLQSEHDFSLMGQADLGLVDDFSVMPIRRTNSAPASGRNLINNSHVATGLLIPVLPPKKRRQPVLGSVLEVDLTEVNHNETTATHDGKVNENDVKSQERTNDESVDDCSLAFSTSPQKPSTINCYGVTDSSLAKPSLFPSYNENNRRNVTSSSSSLGRPHSSSTNKLRPRSRGDYDVIDRRKLVNSLNRESDDGIGLQQEEQAGRQQEGHLVTDRPRGYLQVPSQRSGALLRSSSVSSCYEMRGSVYHGNDFSTELSASVVDVQCSMRRANDPDYVNVTLPVRCSVSPSPSPSLFSPSQVPSSCSVNTSEQRHRANVTTNTVTELQSADEPALNYAEMDLTPTVTTTALLHGSLSKQAQCSDIAYTQIDLIATAAAHKASEEHAQSRQSGFIAKTDQSGRTVVTTDKKSRERHARK